MSLFRQLLITNSQKKKRPYYCEVEYLEGTGTSTRILTDVVIDSLPVSAEIVASTSGTYNSTFQTLVGTTNKSYQYLIGLTSGDAQFAIKYNNATLRSGIYVVADTKYKLKGVLNNDNLTLYVNDGEYTLSRNITANGEEIGLFAQDYNTLTNRIYYCKIWQGDSLVRDLIPVLDWDMTPCMYDKVSGELFYNAGTGEFLYGREIHQVEYLEGTGTQYIDTGVYFNDTTHTYEWDIDAQAVNSGHTSGYNWFTGYNQNGVNSCGTYGDNVTYTFYPAGKYYQDGALVSTPSGGDKYAPVKNKISLTNKICDYSLVLFARMISSSNTIDAGGTKRIFTAKYYDNSVLVRDYIPAVDENGVGFMFDKVTHTIYDNAGTGQFIPDSYQLDENGRVVEPEYE